MVGTRDGSCFVATITCVVLMNWGPSYRWNRCFGTRSRDLCDLLLLVSGSFLSDTALFS
jgi:hypothetical protein